jgi:hypothetical protein
MNPVNIDATPDKNWKNGQLKIASAAQIINDIK